MTSAPTSEPSPRDRALAAALGEDGVRALDQVVDGRTRITTVVIETSAPRSTWVGLAERAVEAVTPTLPEGTEAIDVHVKDGPGDTAYRWSATAAPGGPLRHGQAP